MDEHKEAFANLCKGFMIPEIAVNESFVLVCDDHQNEVWIPLEYYDPDQGFVIDRSAGYFARLSAPGYLDCTEWVGPFETEREAEEDLVEMYGY